MPSQLQFTVERSSPALWNVSFSNPPINLIDASSISELESLVGALESDPEVKVVVFRSADPEFFIAHIDITVDYASMPPGKLGLPPWVDLLSRLSAAPVFSIAALRGRARGAGSEFALACDVRFASREKAVIGQFEVGVGAVPGANPMLRLAHMIGRGRTLEVILGADDFSGELAERYGYVNRAVPDAQFESFVDAFAKRVAGFEKQTLLEAKAFVDEATLPANAEFQKAWDAFAKSSARPETQARAMSLMKRGAQQRTDRELHLAQATAEFRPER